MAINTDAKSHSDFLKESIDDLQYGILPFERLAQEQEIYQTQTVNKSDLNIVKKDSGPINLDDSLNNSYFSNKNEKEQTGLYNADKRMNGRKLGQYQASRDIIKFQKLVKILKTSNKEQKIKIMNTADKSAENSDKRYRSRDQN